MLQRLLPLICLLVAVAPLDSARATSADESFADGNRLFRDDLYWAALLRYRQAMEDGLESPLLYYNMGIAHYRARQHVRARDALLRAIDNPELRVAAHYNLGLNAYQLGDTDEALRWFRLARDQNTNSKLQQYAVVAISRIRDEQAKPDAYDVRVREREEKRNLTDLELYARVGFGSDDNVYRTPDQTYVDLADPLNPLITPETASGAYVPLRLGARYRINSLKFEGFYVAYRLSGRYYEDEALENANEYQHQVSFGSDYEREDDGRKRKIHSAFTIAQHDQTYFDPDNGASRDIDGEDIGNRMNYLRYGPEATFRQSGERLAVGAKIKGQLWNYEEQERVPEYDHEYFLVSLYGQYKFTPSSLFRVTLDGYSRRFGDRPGFDLDGRQRVGNPNIRYDYYALEFMARQRILRSLWIGAELSRTERLDQYVGYNDYARDSLAVEINWTPSKRFSLNTRGAYRLYDFPSAFAFHESTAGRKTQESFEVSVRADFRMTRGLSLFAEGRFNETVSNDTRIQYERNQYAIGIRWEH